MERVQSQKQKGWIKNVNVKVDESKQETDCANRRMLQASSPWDVALRTNTELHFHCQRKIVPIAPLRLIAISINLLVFVSFCSSQRIFLNITLTLR